MEIEIEKYSPCHDALEFRKQYPSFKEAWEACPRGDWMLWIAKRLNVDLRKLTLAKAECAKTVIHLMRDQRSKTAIEFAIKFGNNEATREELAAAAADAAAAAADADADAAAAAAADADADADAYAADAAAAAAAAAAADADADAYAADAAADAADAAAYDAYAADVYARKNNRQQTANLCRQILTDVVFEKLGINATEKY